MKTIRHRLYAFIAIFATVLVPWGPAPARADLQPMADRDLAGVSGAGGISIGIGDLSLYLHTETLSYTDTDTGNAFSLEGITLSGGDQQFATFAVGNVDTNGDGLYSPLTLDVETGDAAYGAPVLRIEALDWLQAVNIHVDALYFCEASLGSLDMGVIERPTFYWLLGAHDDGIDFESGQRLSIGSLQYTYNTLGDLFALDGIYLGASDDGAPEDPTTWEMTGVFQIGALTEGNPATFDVGQGDDGLVTVSLNLPMSGSLRVANVQWGGTDFGPVAIDGIQVHRLTVQLVP